MPSRLFLAAAIAATSASAVPADAAPPSIHRRAVDRLTVTLPDGGEAELIGLFAGAAEVAAGGEAVKTPPNTVRFAVRRGDVDLDHPGLIKRWEHTPTAVRDAPEPPAEAPKSGDPVKIAEQLRDRLVPWMERRAETPSISLHLEQEFERVSDLLADVDEGVPVGGADDEGPVEPETTDVVGEPSVRREVGPWAVLAVPREAVQRSHRTAPHRRKLAMHAWNAGLRGVGYRSADDLGDDLRDADIDTRLAPAAPWSTAVAPPEEPAETPFVAQLQSDDEWAARVAIVESALLDEFSFQGTGSTLIKTPKAGQAVNGQALMMQMAGGQYQDLIDELTQPNAFSRRAENQRRLTRNKTATDAADRAGRSGVRVTRVAMDAAARKATVESEFLVKSPAGTWLTAWKSSELRGFDDADPETQRRIREDPQVKNLLNGGGGALGGLGGLLGGGALGGGGGGGLVEMAVQGGAASKSALDSVNARWEAFRTPYLDRLDGPPLPTSGR